MTHNYERQRHFNASSRKLSLNLLCQIALQEISFHLSN